MKEDEMADIRVTSATTTAKAVDEGAQNTAALDRRRFFKVLGGASGVALAAPLASTDAHAGESKDEARKSRYRETDHVKKFYSTNRY
jgi:hypothetical protein